jgi:hypothetical protein
MLLGQGAHDGGVVAEEGRLDALRLNEVSHKHIKQMRTRAAGICLYGIRE